MTVTRRGLLGAAAGVVGSALAGCTSSPESDAVGRSDGSECGEGDRSSVAAERAIPSGDVREDVEPIRFEELSDAEKDVAATAIRGESYAECPPVSEAFASFLDRIRDHRSEQQERSQADRSTVYLVRERTYYSLSVTNGDATADRVPPRNPGPSGAQRNDAA